MELRWSSVPCSRTTLRLSVCLAVIGGVHGVLFAGPESTGELFPPIEPYETGILKVDELHEIYYELCGNPKGKPVFVLHGGPGSGCWPGMRRYFDPQKFLIVLHDQRGCGRSRPYAELRDNTTQHLVADIEQLRRHIGVERMIVFGGSWGSTLGLAYGEAYPQHVSGMVLRGIFTGTQAEIDHFYGDGVRTLFPEAAERLDRIAPIRSSRGQDRAAGLLALLTSEDADVRRRTALAWVRYEVKVSLLERSDEALERSLADWDNYPFALLENHYMANACFLEEGQLLRDADRLRDIPIVLVNGRYDVPCPPVTAYRLHRRLPRSKLVIVERAGHSSGEPGIRAALVNAMRDFE